METSVILGIIGLASALIAVLSAVMKQLIEVIKNNTQANANLANAINTNNNHLAKLISSLERHDRSAEAFMEAELRPALEEQREFQTMITKLVDKLPRRKKATA